MKASNCVNNIQGVDRDEYLRIKKLHESTTIIIIPETGLTEAMKIRANNAPAIDDL
jgi:hypothetical protein